MHRRTDALPLISAAVLAVWLAASAAVSAASAQPAGVGLVIGNADYAALPALPACVESSRVIADDLRRLGYHVIDRRNLSGGGMAGAIGEFSKEAEASPAASLFIYFCGYASGMNDRPFVLPISAKIRRPSDVMTQGILAKAFLDVISRDQSSSDSAPVSAPISALVALDLFTPVDMEAPVLRSLTEVSLSDGAGLVAVVNPSTIAGSAALSAALSAGLAEPAIESGSLLSPVQSALADSAVAIDALVMPLVSRPLVVEVVPPVTVSTPAVSQAPNAGTVEVDPSPIPDDATSVISSGEPRMAEPAATAPTPWERNVDVPPFPHEHEMTVGERRRVQQGLAAIGYYSGAIDGLFGPETRAAIRRFQYEINVEMTGVITGGQAARLLSRP